MYAKVDLCKKIIFQRAENWNKSSFLNILTQLAEDLGQLGTLSSKFLATKILYAWTSKYGQNIFSIKKVVNNEYNEGEATAPVEL